MGDTMINCLCSLPAGHLSTSMGRVYLDGLSAQCPVAQPLWTLGGFQETIAAIHRAISTIDEHHAAGQAVAHNYFQWAAASDFYRSRLRSYSVCFDRICQTESFV